MNITKSAKFCDGSYPYKKRMTKNRYEKQKAKLQVELLKAQRWAKETGQRIVALYEGRDAAGKGGTIKRFMEHLNPRGARVVALEKPSEREKNQWYFQRYVRHLPTAGEMVLQLMRDRWWCAIKCPVFVILFQRSSTIFIKGHRCIIQSLGRSGKDPFLQWDGCF